MLKELNHLAQELSGFRLDKEVRIMEVCGTHTTEFFKTGVKDLFPQGLCLIDGPGCPVCVTPNGYLDRAIAIGAIPNVIIATFGDMVKVPSSYSSLALERTRGMCVEVVYSPLDALFMAEKNPGKQVVFLSVGFETTAPAEAVTLKEAKKKNLKNFTILPGNKLTPPAVHALLDAGDALIDGFILPGHVSAVIGVEGWRFVPVHYRRPCVVAGFENHDLIRATLILLHMIVRGSNGIANEYARVVRENGNPRARELMYEVFAPAASTWRGLGEIPGSGLVLRDEYAGFNAAERFSVDVPEPREHRGCRCGELLRGIIVPPECPLFGKPCTPEEPVGPCMVSTEGPCAAYFKYGGQS